MRLSEIHEKEVIWRNELSGRIKLGSFQRVPLGSHASVWFQKVDEKVFGRELWTPKQMVRVVDSRK